MITQDKSSHEKIFQILKTFESNTDSYKKEALDLALMNRAELTPALLDVLRSAAENPYEFLESGSDSLSYAAVLLAYWEEDSAFTSFAKFAHFAEDLLDELWGDMVTQDFQTFLFRTGKNNADGLKKLAVDSSAYIYIRSAALQALNWCVVTQLLTRDHMQQFYVELFNDSKIQTDSEIMGNILGNWLDLHPLDHLTVIQQAFAKNLVDKMIAGDFDEIKEDLLKTNWDACLNKMKKVMATLMPEDIHGYTSWWSGNFEPSNKGDLKFQENAFEALMIKLEMKMRYPELRAYLLGAIMGLELLPPSYLIPEILLQGTKHETKFDSAEQAKQFYAHFQNLWNELASWPTEAAPPIFQSMELDPEIQLIFEKKPHLAHLPIFRRWAEVKCFLSALIEANTDDATIRDKKVVDAFHWVQNHFSRVDAVCQKLIANNNKLTEIELTEIQSIFAESDAHWPTHYQILKVGLQAQRVLDLEAKRIFNTSEKNEFAPMERSAPKVGRNEPCPCGSGKKLKKCCLQ